MIATIHPCETGELLICFSHDDVEVEMFVEVPHTIVSCDDSRQIPVHEHGIESPEQLLKFLRKLGFNPTSRT